MNMRVGLIKNHTLVEGPGVRFSLWVQGCPLRCLGCFNPQFFDFAGGTETTPQALKSLLERSLSENHNLEGITLLGGEPFSQAEGCYLFARYAKDAGLSVVTFTGYTYQAIQKKNLPYWRELVSVTDVLVAGPFLQDKIDRKRPWLGSTNQQYHFLTSRYRLEDFREPDGIEISIEPNGRVIVNGWAETKEFNRLLAGL
jgi:anaerobic ribonucleoside-triphosphate reductase activating protein